MSKGVGNAPGTAPSSANLRKPTDSSQFNGICYNPPRYAEHGGLSSSGKTNPTVNNAPSGAFRMPGISKPHGGRG